MRLLLPGRAAIGIHIEALTLYIRRRRPLYFLLPSSLSISIFIIIQNTALSCIELTIDRSKSLMVGGGRKAVHYDTPSFRSHHRSPSIWPAPPAPPPPQVLVAQTELREQLQVARDNYSTLPALSPPCLVKHRTDH